MRKLKLQVQISIDGYVGGPNGELDWMEWNWDDALKNYVTELTDSVDTILLGRKMTDGFITHWANAVKNPDDPSYSFAKKMMDKPKYVFTKTLNETDEMVKKWENTSLVKGDLSEEIHKLKNQAGQDIIVYGGAEFVSNLVKASLVDELHLFVNPTAVTKGLSIFKERTSFKLIESKVFDCGIVLLKYKP